MNITISLFHAIYRGRRRREPFSVVRALFASSWIVEEGILVPKKEGLLDLQHLFFGAPLPFVSSYDLFRGTLFFKKKKNNCIKRKQWWPDLQTLKCFEEVAWHHMEMCNNAQASSVQQAKSEPTTLVLN